MVLETLYKKSKTGAVVYTDISVDGAVITVTTGQVGTDKPTHHKTECEPKNVGRANATTAEEQAIVEAEAKHKKKIKDGYVLETHGELTVKLPMKVKKYEDQKKNIIFPCWSSPKLDGVNGEFRDGDEMELFSRGGDNYPMIAHMKADLDEAMLSLGFEALAGEIYKHGEFLQDIQSAVKKHNDMTPHLTFHIFDLPTSDDTYDERREMLATAREELDLKYVKIIEMVEMHSHEDIEAHFNKCIAEGYEGTVIRNNKGLCEYNTRSVDAFKYKKPLDAEYQIVSHNIDKHGHAVFVCTTGTHEFKVKMKGTDEARLEIAANAESYYGKFMKIEYETLSKDSKPLKPVGICFRKMDANGEAAE